jgi:hypothetical protein
VQCSAVLPVYCTLTQGGSKVLTSQLCQVLNILQYNCFRA